MSVCSYCDRALPCPAVKHSEEWGDPSKCEGVEGCQYCHTRTEQQFHPEVGKCYLEFYTKTGQHNEVKRDQCEWMLCCFTPPPPHTQIYKSTKCNDMQQCGSCPRGPFCAFAHVDSKTPYTVSINFQTVLDTHLMVDVIITCRISLYVFTTRPNYYVARS